MQVICGKCKQPIAVEDVDLKRSLAKCTACGELFDCSTQLDDIVSAPPTPEQEGLPVPPKFRVLATEDSLRIEYRSWANWFLALFAGGAGAIMMSPGTAFLIGGAPGRSDSGVGILFALGFTGLGLLICYVSLAQLLNRTTLTIADGLLRVREEPIPFPNSREVWLPSLQRIYVKPVGDRDRIDNNQVSYVLFAAAEFHGEVALTDRLRTEEEALFVKQEIEKFLGIEDRTVCGEVES